MSGILVVLVKFINAVMRSWLLAVFFHYLTIFHYTVDYNSFIHSIIVTLFISSILLSLHYYKWWWENICVVFKLLHILMVSSCRISVFICPSLITNETDYLFILCRYLDRLFCEFPIVAFLSFFYCFLPFSFEIFEVLWILWIKVLYQIHTNIVYQSVAFIFILLVVFLMKKSL